MKFAISHLTRYNYDRAVQFLPHLVYLRPRENPLLQVNRFIFTLFPSATVSWMRDDFDNLPASIRFTGTGRQLDIESSCEVITSDLPPFDFLLRTYAASFPFEYEPLHRFNLSIYLTPPPRAEQETLRAWIRHRLRVPPRETVAWLAAINHIISATHRYQRREAPGIQTAIETTQAGSGTCRDFAVLLIACARTFGLAARFVSGYLYDSAAPADQPGDMHAWAEVFLPGAGWRGLDPTHGVFCDRAYIPVAHAVVPESINPVQGAISCSTAVTTSLFTQVRVQPAA